MNILNAFFEWVLLASFRASCLVPCVLLAQTLWKNRLPSSWRYALWLPVLMALLVPALPILPSWMQWRSPLPGTSHVARKVTSVETSYVSTVKQDPTATIEFAGGPVESVFRPGMASDGNGSLEWRTLLSMVWLAGFATISLFVYASHLHSLKSIRRHELPIGSDLQQRIMRMARDAGLRRLPRVIVSTAVTSPSVCGLWRPTLLLNADFQKDLSDEETEMILSHELTHLLRGDVALNAILGALLALHWFNPLLWFTFFRVRADREAACDAQVLEGAPPTRRAAYGHALLKLETSTPSGLGLGFVGILQRVDVLRQRIHAIISQPQPTRTMKTNIILCVAALAVAGITKASDPKPGADIQATAASAATGKVKQPEITRGVKIEKSVGNYGFIFRNFKFTLTPRNTLLPNDPGIVAALGLKRNPENYHDTIPDDQSDGFKVGGFSIHIPVKDFPLVHHQDGYVNVIMAQTLVDNEYDPVSKDPHRLEYVKEKQALYHRIENMVKSGKGEVEVVLEFPNHDSDQIDKNVYFREAFGHYINYTGQLREARPVAER